MPLTPTVFDIDRIERLLVSINAKVGTIESLLISQEERQRAFDLWSEDLENGTDQEKKKKPPKSGS